MTLFLPHGVPGFVSRVDGTVRLREILIPMANKPGPQASVDAVAGLIRQLKLPAGHVTLLHAGPEIDMPPCRIPAGTGWNWTPVAEPGNAVSVITKHATERDAGLIVMTTDGPDGFLDGLRGTTSERVLHQARRPVAILPVGPMAGLQG
jgi:nucleotide-binding universal stress UspA family protein